MTATDTQIEHLAFDVERIRRDFPILKREVNGKPLVYLDNAATSQRPVQVLAEITRFYRDHNANIHRGVHTLSVEATDLHNEARAKLARFINAARPQEVVFTRNTTESINLVAHSWGRKFLQAGDEVVISEIEHHSNIVPWQMLRDERGIVLKYIPMLPDGTLDLEYARQIIGPKTKLLAVTAVANALGTIVPLHELIPMAKAHGAMVLVDGAQSVPHMPVDVQALGADFLAFSSHKMLGPTGMGVLWGRIEVLDAMDPFMGGGDMISTVSMERSTWADVPAKFEAGTPDIAGAVAFGAAVDYLSALGMDAVRAHELELTEYALRRLGDVPGVSIFGPPEAKDRGGVVSFELEGVHPHDVGQVLDTHGVAIRTGHHCAQPVMAALSVPATARASFYIYNTPEEVDKLAVALEEVSRFFGGGPMTGDAGLLEDLYREIILDHYRAPRNHVALAAPSCSADGSNPLCGDQVTVEVGLDGSGVIREVAFTGQGCSISQASASMMTEYVKGRTPAEARAGAAAFQRMMTTGEAQQVEGFDDIDALQGVAKFPARVKCASLAWKTLEQALEGGGAVSTDERTES